MLFVFTKSQRSSYTVLKNFITVSVKVQNYSSYTGVLISRILNKREFQAKCHGLIQCMLKKKKEKILHKKTSLSEVKCKSK